MTPTSLLVAALVPLLTWSVSYAILAKHHGRWRLWSVKVHESGERSLAETLFYWNHFLREFPIALLYGLAALWTLRRAMPDLRLHGAQWWCALVGLVALLGVTVARSIAEVGARKALSDLLQYRDRDAHREWGAHWQMHFTSTVAVVALLMLPGSLVGGGERTLAATVWFLLLGLSALFATGRRALRETRWLLHGGREVLTFAVLLWAPLVALVAPRAAQWETTWWTWLLVLLVSVVGLHYLHVLSRTSISEHAAASHLDARYLLANHFFEHFLDLVFICLLVGVLLGTES